MNRLLLTAYRLFCALEGWLSLFLGGERRRLASQFDAPLRDGLDRLARSPGSRSLVVYAPTVGELNAVKSVIALYRQQWPDDRLVLLTAYAQYLDVLARSYPEAAVGLANFRAPWLIDRFFALTRPRLFLIAEGPALHACFPQRLEVALPAGCLAHRVPVVVSNAVLFALEPQSRVDRVENHWFAPLYTRAIGWWFPPYPVFREALVQRGAAAERVEVLGDLRFDSLALSGAPRSDSLERLLARYRECQAPVLVAGSVNQAEEQRIVVEAWLKLRAHHPQARLVIAPRYVNVPEVIKALTDMLTEVGADYVLRSSAASDQGLKDVLIVDVFGELSHLYSVATASYIGRDHGVLEPMAHDCPTLVGTGWRRNYSATPMYDYMVGEGGVICVGDSVELAAAIRRIIEDRSYVDERLQVARRLIERNAGASQRTLAKLRALLTDLPPALNRP